MRTETEEGWITILVDEEKTGVMKVLNTIQESVKVRDVQIEEISTEDVIRKIYEGDMG
jgi:ABC-2 type transport system ATP-binding protein